MPSYLGRGPWLSNKEVELVIRGLHLGECNNKELHMDINMEEGLFVGVVVMLIFSLILGVLVVLDINHNDCCLNYFDTYYI